MPDDLTDPGLGDQFLPVPIRPTLGESAATPATSEHRPRNPYFPPSQEALQATNDAQERFEEDGDLSSYPWTNWTESALSLLRHVCTVSDRVMQAILEIVKHPKFNSADVPSLRKLKVNHKILIHMHCTSPYSKHIQFHLNINICL